MCASVHINGPALANLLASAVAGRVDCDGVLLGTLLMRPVEVYNDDTHGPQTLTTLEVHITGAVCSTSTASFSDAAGAVQASQLQQMLPAGSSMLGTLSCRAGGGASSLAPSMRERALMRSLASAGSCTSCQPLLLIVATGTDHGRATVSTTYRCYRQPVSTGTDGLSYARGALEVVALQLDTAFTDSGQGHGAYSVVLPAVQEHGMLAAPASAMHQAVVAVQAVVQSSLQQLTQLCVAASNKEEELGRLRSELLELLTRA